MLKNIFKSAKKLLKSPVGQIGIGGKGGIYDYGGAV